jgi:hypothetical protein
VLAAPPHLAMSEPKDTPERATRTAPSRPQPSPVA